MESVLITGASGFIGSFIVEEALKRRFGVWAGIRSTSSKKYLKNRKIHFLELDFAHPNELRAQLSGHKGTYNKFDYIIHCAGVTKCPDKNTFDYRPGRGRRLPIIHLPKEFDHHNCRNLRYETDLLMAENYVSRIIFDFTRTRFMDSSGIGVLLNRYKQMKAGHTSFYGACPQVMRVLKVAGILGLMHQYESKEEAIYSREV